ncbi:hypothetical protein BXZ70DRAFT_652915 [Cristinia sonorae]|uniref:Uncharacterized protein n=1 Tax=Cristinia sonorae TaxID=1940300 RepID=A0A8K0XKL8_9AGAR|nr:hypothetical protein BXZ70DRAFT_652915 [Cristinia sonorae]
MLQLSQAGIISTAVEGMLYGVAVLMFLLTMFIFLRDRRRRPLNYGMVAAACSLIILATMEFAVNIVRVVKGCINDGPNYPTGIEGWFSDVSEQTFVMKSGLYNTQTLILDAVVIYRAYTVWQKWWVVVPPCLAWLGLLGCTIVMNHVFVTASSDIANDIFSKKTGLWITITYAETLATNLMATSLLAYRIWTVNRRSSSYSPAGNRLIPMLIVVLESGAIYSMTITAALVTFLVNSPGNYVILDLISPVISIVFNLIIVRMGFTAQRIGLPTLSASISVDVENNHSLPRSPLPPRFSAAAHPLAGDSSSEFVMKSLTFGEHRGSKVSMAYSPTGSREGKLERERERGFLPEL